MRNNKAENSKNDEYWKNRIKPFFKAWSTEVKFIDSEISKNFSLMCIALDKEFEDAIKTVKPVLKPFSDNHYFFKKLQESTHIKNNPKIAFELFATVFDGSIQQWYFDVLKEIMAEFSKVCPELKENSKYKEVENNLKLK